MKRKLRQVSMVQLQLRQTWLAVVLILNLMMRQEQQAD